MRECPGCANVYGRGYKVSVADTLCGKCEKGVQNREEVL